MKSLVLAEKPSVAREIARVLGCTQKHNNYIEGKHYIVTWALGHLIELKMPEDYDKQYKTWRMEDLPILPKHMGLKVIRKTSPQYRAIEQLMKRNDVNEVIIATDAGREGELVARWIIEKAHWKKGLKRLWISSQTDRAIRDGFKQLKPAKDYEALYESAVCRAEADWMIGLNVTRALTTKYNDPLSAGRVQTPTLAMIIDQEKKIQGFKPQKYWKVTATLGPVTAVWEDKGEGRIFHEDNAKQIVNKGKGASATVKHIERKEKSETQPLPYDLTELQQDANRRFGFSAKKTLNTLQNLYEHYKIVTYPRTDSRYLTKDMESTMSDRLKAIASGYKIEVQPALKAKGKVLAKKVFNDAKVTDHHAIIPTEEPLYLGDLSSDERKLYDLIVRRFLTLFYPVHRFESLKVIMDVAGETFVSKSTVVIDPGFKRVTGKEEASPSSNLSLQEGQTLSVKAMTSEQKLTEPPQRFSEADLLHRMEKYGLGTPATRADIIEKLLQSQSVDRQNGRLLPTAKGKQLIELVNNELKSPELTARWEKQLEEIARGKGDSRTFKSNIRKKAAALVSEVKASEQSYRAHNLTGSKCPECGELLKEIKGKEGKILVCSSQTCSYRRRKDPKLSNRRCPQCHKKMEIHKGKAGLYFQCRPCNLVEKAEDKKKAVSKRDERKLLNKYKKKEENINPLAEALKSALKDKD
ncbi:DNA topoisomerase-3 [Pullulanibacillus pueri]|uniref:DNA topoisomerase n=1 Tax=Pullulanibacillus pueri TaxID=1437324 RepID=A0A8J2ZRV5_9BACL|nr:DNA topoisomerase III [Pullulanibacillus pueri]MBM7680003.1 DNA topoisomerase-3 [Pullulanibacillus pueri]GGH73886.1 DNA topoisomerase III [Pullulanibacillus pueri]